MNRGIDAGTLYVCAQEREPVARLSSGRLARRVSDFLLFSRLKKGTKRDSERGKKGERESSTLIKFPRRRFVAAVTTTTAS